MGDYVIFVVYDVFEFRLEVEARRLKGDKTYMVSITQLSQFAVQHLMAAANFSRQCGEIEQEHLGQELGNFYNEQIACTSATILLCVAALESNINEYLFDASRLFPQFDAEQSKVMVELLERLPILDKYEKVLYLKKCDPFNKGEILSQNVSLIIRLRNELVHFHPEWHHEQEEHKKLGSQLSGKFELSPFIQESGSVIFPQRIVGHGCTKWAVNSTLEFMTAFDSKIGFQGKFERFLERMKP
jgi:hypothetical protein